MSQIENLYRRAFQSKRTGPLFNAFSYPTKIDPEAVAVFIGTHTEPGGTVLDPFGGSGSTGIAASLCDRPTERMLALAREAGVRPNWGPRNAVLYEISPLGTLIGRVMASPPDPSAFEAAAIRLIDAATAEFGWAYEATGPDHEPGRIRYIIWTEVLRTPCCGTQLTMWDAAVGFHPLVLKKAFDCPTCTAEVETSSCDRVTSSSRDPITSEVIVQREWRPAKVYGDSTSGAWSRSPTDADRELIERISAMPTGLGIPSGSIDWGDLYRSGYHTGIARFHHLYTGRNLKAIATLWRGIEQHDPALTDALRLVVLSYNANHSTLMTRVVVKKGQKDFVVTGAQSGVMYVSGLPVEKNVFEGVRRKVTTFAEAFALTHGSRSTVTVVNASSANIDMPDDSVDYAFTDPPFGDFIPYAEINQVNEAWLGQLTDRSEEAIISRSQNKGVTEYTQLMTRVFAETARVLRQSGRATVIFHASKPPVWFALGEAFRRNGFVVERTSVLDKTQVSFKQVVHEGGTRGDAIFLLRPDSESSRSEVSSVRGLDGLIHLLKEAAQNDPAELEPRRLFSRYVALCVESATQVEVTAPEFYSYLALHDHSFSTHSP